MNTNVKNNSKSTYNVDVLQNNKIFKEAVRSTGKGLRILKAALQDKPEATPMLRQIDKILNDSSQKLYKEIDKNVQRNKDGQNKGKTCPFWILQAVYRQKEGKALKSNNRPTKTVKVTVKNAPAKKQNAKNAKKQPANNAKSLQGQTVAELKKIASELSLNVPTQIKKADLITMIKKAA